MKRVKIERKSSKNPLFEKWILEWKEEATKSGSDNLKFLYGKAIKSLQKYPFTLMSGKECALLENFGPKLCAMLDKKLESHRKSLTDDEWNKIANPTCVDLENIRSVLEPTAKRKKANSKPSTQSEDSSEVDTYVPKYRSGCYAILVSLFHFNSGLDSITKAELIEKAKDLCDSSFTKSQPGSFYTAWSSMATLISKNLVSKAGRPVRFKLTEKGLKIARNLASISKDDLDIFSAETPPQSPTRLESEKLSISYASFEDVTSNPSETNLSLVPNKPASSKNSAGAKKIRKIAKTDNVIPPISEISNSKSPPSYSKRNEVEELRVVASSSKSGDTCSRNSATNSSSQLSDIYSRSSAIPSSSQSSDNYFSHSASSSKSSDIYSRNSALPISSKSSDIHCHNSAGAGSSQSSDNNFSNSASISEGSAESEETITLFPNNFSIILLIDIHETEMKGKQRSDATSQSLEKRGILCESRHLTVGDFAWIARDRDNPNNELVLPFIVERKRMDDLASSIKDGRFHEQKFRLKGCGLPNVIYLIEKYGHSQRLGLPLSTLEQATVNSQVVDEFAIKVTDNHNHSILYLSTISKHLTRIFKDKTLTSCSASPSPLDLNSDSISLLKFKNFNKASTKHKNLTVKEMLIKQLIQLKGLSVDKALAITNQYPTVHDLIEGLELNGEKSIADLNYTPCRKIGPTLASVLYKFYTQLEFH